MDQKKIGIFIALLRRERGITQAELGEKIGVTNKTVSRWENGKEKRPYGRKRSRSIFWRAEEPVF